MIKNPPSCDEDIRRIFYACFDQYVEMLSQNIEKSRVIGEKIEISLSNIEGCDNNENDFVDPISSSVTKSNEHLIDEIVEDPLQTTEYGIEKSMNDSMEFDMVFDQGNNKISDLNIDNPPTQCLIEVSALLHHHEVLFFPRKDEEDHYALIDMKVEVSIIEDVKYLHLDFNLDALTQDNDELELDDDPRRLKDVAQTTMNMKRTQLNIFSLNIWCLHQILLHTQIHTFHCILICLMVLLKEIF